MNFTDNIYLVSESGEIPIECFIKNKDSQYCNIKDITKIKTGNYKIKVSERIQKINYAVKAQESQSFMINQILDLEKLRDSYKIDFLLKDTFYIKIYLAKETYSKISDIPAIFNNNNDLKLNYIRDDNDFSFNYEINKTFIESHYEITEDYKEYKIDLLSKKGESFLKIYVEIRKRKEDENDGIDISTLSNYKDVPINYIYGEFKPDFDNKIIYGELNYNLEAMNDGDKIIFDTIALNIKKVYEVIDPKEDEFRELEFSFGEEDENLGTPLIIHLNYFLGDYIIIKIIYETTENGTSAQFLTKEQTFGKQYPYFFTQSEMILGRSLLPCQDTPDIKFGFDLSIIVPKDLRGMISGRFRKEEIYSKDNNYKIYEYGQKEPPIPSYLIAMAAGNIVERKINDIISVFSEPEYINDVYNELYEDLPKALELAIKYMGPYEWGKYNVLVLPRSFPYSGMENPCLSFLSPCLINGDKSLIDIIFHEMIHSWSGNLVTNENWADFWLNEGITMFLQRKIVGQMKNDTEYARMDGYLGRYYIKEAIDYFGEEQKDFTTLRPNLTGICPDDSFSDIPYEKGYNFVYLIEHLIGEEMMEKFFKSYFAHFKYQSLNYYQFKNYFIKFCEENSISNETLSKIDWNAWIFTPGDIPEEVNETNRYKEEADSIVEKIKNENFDNLENEFKTLPSVSKTYILLTLEQFEEDFLTEKQHEFLTETLELYTGQNFLVSTNYFRLILEKTDKFYDNETDSLLNYLSNYGASDYMAGLYGAFYKRDEILAESTLDSLKTFYHSLMYDMACEEIEEAKKEFPIMMINVEENKKFYYPYDDLFDLNVEEYKEDLGELNIKNNIYLVFQNTNEENKLELNCVINKENKYCQLQQNKSLELFGKYNIKLDERIQKKEYAIKAKESNKFDIIQLYNETSTETKYSYDYGKSDSLKIIINLIEEIKFDIPVYFNNSKDLKLKCEVKDKNYECELNKTFCESYCTKSKDEVKYKINILSKSEISFLEIDVGIKKSESETSSGDGDTDILVIVLPCAIAALLIIGIIVFLILRKRRLSPENTEEECKELISVGLKDSETKEN